MEKIDIRPLWGFTMKLVRDVATQNAKMVDLKEAVNALYAMVDGDSHDYDEDARVIHARKVIGGF